MASAMGPHRISISASMCCPAMSIAREQPMRWMLSKRGIFNFADRPVELFTLRRRERIGDRRYFRRRESAKRPGRDAAASVCGRFGYGDEHRLGGFRSSTGRIARDSCSKHVQFSNAWCGQPGRRIVRLDHNQRRRGRCRLLDFIGPIDKQRGIYSTRIDFSTAGLGTRKFARYGRAILGTVFGVSSPSINLASTSASHAVFGPLPPTAGSLVVGGSGTIDPVDEAHIGSITVNGGAINTGSWLSTAKATNGLGYTSPISIPLNPINILSNPISTSGQTFNFHGGVPINTQAAAVIDGVFTAWPDDINDL